MIKKIKNIFKNFFQVKNSQCISNGSGLGLYITKQLVELLGGTINIESEKNKYTTFYFTIKNIDYNSISDTSSLFLKDKTILVISKKTNYRMLINNILYSLNSNPIICPTFDEAIFYIKT